MNHELAEEIIRTQNLIRYKEEIEIPEKYSPIHLFTTENIKGITDNIDFRNKDILLPCSSGDHIFNALLFNPNKIKVYDINSLTKHIFELKKAAILKLNKEEYLEYFYMPYINISNKLLNYKTYIKIREKLPINSLIYWDYIYREYKESEIKKSKLFLKNASSKKEIIGINPYLQDNNYEILKEKLKDYNIDFINGDIIELSKNQEVFNGDKYDYIYLSNIADYFHSKDVLKQLKEVVLNLKKILKENGQIGILYLYSYMDDYFYESKNPLYNQFKRNEYFGDNEYSYVNFPSTTIQKPGKTMAKVLNQNKDGILTYKNKITIS